MAGLVHTLNQTEVEEQFIEVKRKFRGGEQLTPKCSFSIGCGESYKP